MVKIIGKTYPPMEWDKVAVVLRYPVHPTIIDALGKQELEMPLKSFVNLLKTEGLLN